MDYAPVQLVQKVLTLKDIQFVALGWDRDLECILQAYLVATTMSAELRQDRDNPTIDSLVDIDIEPGT